MVTELLNKTEISRAQEITQLHNEIACHLKISLTKAIRVGELLWQQKESKKHGEFIPWVQEHLPFTDRTARNYMRLYRERAKLKTENVSDLSVTGGYRMLSAPLASLRLERREEKLKAERDKIEYARNHSEEVPVGQVVRGKAGAGNWECMLTIEGEISGLPIKHFECVDPQYRRLKEGEAPLDLKLRVDSVIFDLNSIDRQVRNCLAKYKEIINKAYWIDFNRGVCSMSPDVVDGLRELASFVKEWKRKHAEALHRLEPPEKGDWPRPGWSTWGVEA